MLVENRRLVKENAQLRRANEILKAASAYFAAELDPARRRSGRSSANCQTASRSRSRYAS
jgi:transposase-like protein